MMIRKKQSRGRIVRTAIARQGGGKKFSRSINRKMSCATARGTDSELVERAERKARGVLRGLAGVHLAQSVGVRAVRSRDELK